jgi:hypothetical protein
MPALVLLTAMVHFASQIISSQFYTTEIPALGALLYMLGGALDIVVAAHVLKKAIDEKSQQFMRMGIGLCLLGMTFVLLGWSVMGLFGPVTVKNVDVAIYLLVIGTGLSALFFAASPTPNKQRSGAVTLVVALFLLLVLVVGLYQMHKFLPPLYISVGIPTLLRQQLLTGVLILFFLAALRFALFSGGKNPKESVQWYIIGMSILALVMLNYLLSAYPGDAYSWAARFFHVMASGAFIQYLWWDKQGE